MPRDITVTFDDGESIVLAGVPDNASPEQVAGRARNQFGKGVKAVGVGPVPTEEGGNSFLSTLGKEARRIGSDVVKGLGSMGALLLDANNPQGQTDADLATAMIPGRSSGPPKSEGPLPFGASKALQSIGPEAVTNRERWQGALTQGVAGSVVNPVGGISRAIATAPIRTGITGGAAGLGAEVGGRLSNDNPLARIIGGVAGGGATGAGLGLAARARPQSAELAREAVAGLDEATLGRAAAFQQRAAAEGVTMDLAQALEATGAPATNVATLRDVLANSPHGQRVQAGLRAQPGQLEALADGRVSALPGEALDRNAAANRIASAATSRITQATRDRTAAVRGDYEKVGTLPSDGVESLLRTIEESAGARGATESLRTTAAGLSQRLRELQARGSVDARDIDTAIGDAIGAYKGSPTYLANPKATGQIKSLAARINERFQELSPEIAAAEANFARISRETVNPLKQGPVGQLAGRGGYAADKQSPAGTLEAIFSRGTDAKAGTAEIPTLMRELARVDPGAGAAAVKTFLRGRLDKAFDSAPGGEVGGLGAADSARRVYDSLFKTRAQWQGVRDMVAGSARGMGMEEKAVAEAVRGVEALAQITKGLANRPQSVGGLRWDDVAKAGGRSTLADTARLWGFAPTGRIAARIEEGTLARTFQQFDSLLTTPEGVATLQALSRQPVMSTGALSTLATFGGTVPTVTSD